MVTQKGAASMNDARRQGTRREVWVGRGGLPLRRLCCAAALLLVFTEYWLLNYCAFPLFDTVFVGARELSAFVGGLVLAALALLSFWSDRPVRNALFTGGVVAGMVAGGACVAGGVLWTSVPLVALGASLVTVGSGLANIYVGLAFVGMRLRDVALSVAAAYVASFGLRGAFALLPTGVNLALFGVLPLASLLLAGRFSRAFLAGLGGPESPAQMAVTAPRSFLPFSDQVFVTLIVFRVVYGYTLTFGEVRRVPVVSLWALVPLGMLLVAMVVGAAWGSGPGETGSMGSRGVRRASRLRELFPDTLFKASVLLSVAGFLFVLLNGSAWGTLAQALLAAGTGFFEILMYYVLIAIGTRNPMGALPALSWGNAMASWGTIIGAALGRLANQAGPVTPGLATIAMALGLVAYVLLVLPRFSFARTIDEVAPAAGSPAVPDDGAEASPSRARRCAELADRTGLTDREREVFDLLAYGRNARYIQDALAISYSTAKTHVSHIYRKLGVHSQQELLSLVEGAAQE